MFYLNRSINTNEVSSIISGNKRFIFYVVILNDEIFLIFNIVCIFFKMLAFAAVIVLVIILVYYFVLAKSKVARIRLYKPESLVNSQSGDDSSYQIAQVVLFDSDGKALSAADLKITSGATCYGTKPETAFDGDITNQAYPHLYHSCAKDPKNFLQADLVNPQSLSIIKVYNRSDCCANRLAGVVLETYDSSDKLINSYTLTSKLIVLVDLVNNEVQ